MNNNSKKYPVWAEIDLSAIAHNLKVVKQLVGPSTQIMAVVKANGYGHGAISVSRVASDLGVTALGVARASEGVILRKAGRKQSILVFGYTPPTLTELLIKHDLTQTIFSLSYAELLNHYAGQAGGRLHSHLKIDTGMGRLGLPVCHVDGDSSAIQFQQDTFYETANQICALTNLDIEGVYTHLAASDIADKSSAQEQIALFKSVVSSLDAGGRVIPTKHAANSAAVIELPEAHLDMVRPGIMLYGLYPSDEISGNGFALQPAMQIKAQIAQIKDVPRGFSVSYGHTYRTPTATRLATIPIGYGDGYNRLLSSSGFMLVRGQRAPVVGRVCMDQTIIDVGHIRGVCADDEVVVLGRQENESITADEIARLLGTINYEIVSTLMERVPRVIV